MKNLTKICNILGIVGIVLALLVRLTPLAIGNVSPRGILVMTIAVLLLGIGAALDK